MNVNKILHLMVPSQEVTTVEHEKIGIFWEFFFLRNKEINRNSLKWDS